MSKPYDKNCIFCQKKIRMSDQTGKWLPYNEDDSIHAKPEAMVVFPIPVSVPVINTPCIFLLDRDVIFFFVNKT